MLNLYTNVSTGSIAIWPATGSSTDSIFSLELIHDMDLVSSSFSLTLTNTPDNLSEYYRFNYTGSNIPTASGQYTYNLKDDSSIQLKWSEVKDTWSGILSKWSSVQTGSGDTRNIDSGRAFVFGDNDPEFTNYVSDNEQGNYVTYNS